MKFKCGRVLSLNRETGKGIGYGCPTKWYSVRMEDGSECPLSKIKFETEEEAEEIVGYLNKLVTKPRFELKSYDTRCYVIWDNLKQKQVPFIPFHMKAGDPRNSYQEYVDFLNELYEETPQYE